MSRKSPGKNTADAEPPKVFGSNGVFYTFPQGADGPIQVKVDFSKVPEPPSYYFADAFLLEVDEAQGMTILSFGRREKNGEGFADRVDIAMPAKSLRGSLASFREAKIEEAVDKILAATGAAPQFGPIAPTNALAQTFFANSIFLAAGDGESNLDFYYLSPREIHLAKLAKKDMQIFGIVRIIVSTVLTKHFLNILKSYSDRGINPYPVQAGSRRAAT